MRVIKWIKGIFAWRIVRDTGVWTYWENPVTGAREARWSGGCYQPVNYDFLNAAPGSAWVFGPRGRETKIK